MTDTVLAPTLDYKPAGYRHGSKVFTRIFQQTGGQTVVIPVATNYESIFEIPQKAFYLADSYIKGTATPTLLAARNNWLHSKHNFISEIYLYTRGGKYLAFLNQLPNYMEMTQDMNTSMDEFIGRDVSDRYYPSRANGTLASAGGRAVGDLVAVPPVLIQSAAPYTEPQYLEAGTVLATATPVVQFTFRLGDIKDTVFALKKGLLPSEPLLMRIVWGPAQRFGFMSDSLTVAHLAPQALNGPITITNLGLHLAVEEDPMLIDDMRTTTAGGFQLPIPFVSVKRDTDGAATQLKSITVKLTPDMGYAVKRLIYAPFNRVETLNTSLDHDNRLGSKIDTYQTSLDSLNRQQYPIDCITTFDDWKMHQWLFKKTPIQCRDIYQYNWVHVEDFSDLSIERKDELQRQANPDNIVSGMPIVQNGLTERIWNIAINNRVTAANQLNHYTFIIGYKTMIVTPSGIDVVSIPPMSR